MVQRAAQMQAEGRELSKMDFKLHFFAWFKHSGYRLETRFSHIPADLDEYFLSLKADHGIQLDDEQKSWYAAKRHQIGPDSMFREYPSFPEEAFKSSIEGAYFKREMTRARLDGRICDLPFDAGRLVNTFWDIGNDTTSIWFHQSDGVRHRMIDYYENADESIMHYARELKSRAERNGWTYGRHYGPHDFGNTEWAGPGKSRVEIAKGLGLNFTVVPRIDDKDDAIDVARQFLGMCWFDQKRTEQGVRCLDNYRKKWNEALGTWSREPLHNWASHGADSFMTGAVGYRPAKPKKESRAVLPTISAGNLHNRGAGWMGRL
jgi:hypothetical protein